MSRFPGQIRWCFGSHFSVFLGSVLARCLKVVLLSSRRAFHKVFKGCFWFSFRGDFCPIKIGTWFGLRAGMNTMFVLVFGEILARCLKVVLLGFRRAFIKLFEVRFWLSFRVHFYIFEDGMFVWSSRWYEYRVWFGLWRDFNKVFKGCFAWNLACL